MELFELILVILGAIAAFAVIVSLIKMAIKKLIKVALAIIIFVLRIIFAPFRLVFGWIFSKMFAWMH